ncbi:MAG TPA: anthranilate phosphoribosyltransferase [Gemmatimonadota bacterium]|nr:anthranilate phosphoribosyltransferase [Gemmatimonadota bacterium]
MSRAEPEAADPRACLRAVVAGRDLSAAEAEALFGEIMDGRVPQILIGALLAALAAKGETVQEIAGAARVMRARAERLTTSRGPLVDTCGTGGDFSGTFNVSTTAALVAAAGGAAVAKHGNRAASSKSGSADVLEALGVAIELAPAAAGRCLDEVGIAFLYAPRFHPAMRHAIEARRAVGIRTIFNLLGPVTNPAGARRQVAGVPEARWVEPVARVLADLGAEHALVVHGEERLDELSVAGPTRVAEVRDGDVRLRTVTPTDLGLDPTGPDDRVSGGDAAENARVTESILAGRGTPAQSAITAANAGAALYVAGRTATLREGVDMARQILAEAKAVDVLHALVEASQRLAREEEEGKRPEGK